MTDQRRIPAPRAVVWDALNDPEVLKLCIPGCERLAANSGGELEATAAVLVGPISAHFKGKVYLSDLDPPRSYSILGEGQGGPAGFAKGGAKVHLTAEGVDQTLLSYQVNAQVGGKIAQLGARLIDSTAKAMADAFFSKFSEVVTDRMTSPEHGYSTAGGEATRPADPAVIRPAVLWSMIPERPLGYPRTAWVGVALWIIIFLLMVGPLL